MNKENCALKLVDEIILCYDAQSKKHQISAIVSLTILLSKGKTEEISQYHNRSLLYFYLDLIIIINEDVTMEMGYIRTRIL